jgi:hypothetical protein
MGYLKYLALAGVIALSLVALLVLNGVQPPAANESYTDKVLEILAFKNIGVDPGFKNTMLELIDSLGCGVSPDTGRDTCKLPFRFQHLRSLAKQDVPRIAEYKAQVGALQVPERYRLEHDRLYESLEDIYRSLDGMLLSTDQVVALLKGNSPETLDPILAELARRLEITRRNLVGIIKGLYALKWLEPALPPLPSP